MGRLEHRRRRRSFYYPSYMKHLLSILLSSVLLLAVTKAQTIRTLGYNATNGEIVAATNLVWTNSFGFSSGAASEVLANLGLAETNAPTFLQVTASGQGDAGQAGAQINGADRNFVIFYPGYNFTIGESGISLQGTSLVSWSTNGVVAEKPLQFTNATIAAQTRTNLSLGLPALTNTSNVTAMRALAGSTNAAHPFSGNFVFVDDSANTWSATVSNGIILSIVEQ